jgi:hypothetical protein
MKEKSKIRGDGPAVSEGQRLLELLGVTSIAGITFNKAAELHLLLGINNISDLYKACKEGKVAKLKGWGEIKQEKIKSEIEAHVLWLASQCNKVKKDLSSDYQRPLIDKEFLLSLARSQAEKNNNK